MRANSNSERKSITVGIWLGLKLDNEDGVDDRLHDDLQLGNDEVELDSGDTGADTNW